MADREAQQKLYAYSEMSNKVQQAERSRRVRGEGTGEVETLRGRSDIGRMGDRITKSDVEKRPAELEEMMERAKKKKQKREPTTGKKDNILLSSGGQSILDLGELNRYQPTHAGSRSAYENLLVRVSFLCCIFLCFLWSCPDRLFSRFSNNTICFQSKLWMDLTEHDKIKSIFGESTILHLNRCSH